MQELAYDYDTFEKIQNWEKSSFSQEYGSHKTLDYLNISLNMPLRYHAGCDNLQSNNYTKGLHDLIYFGSNWEDPRSMRRKLKNLNHILYLNNKLYSSDKQEMDFIKSGVSFVKAGVMGNDKSKAYQHIMIVDNKQIVEKYATLRDHLNEDDFTYNSSEEDDREEEKSHAPF